MEIVYRYVIPFVKHIILLICQGGFCHKPINEMDERWRNLNLMEKQWRRHYSTFYIIYDFMCITTIWNKYFPTIISNWYKQRDMNSSIEIKYSLCCAYIKFIGKCKIVVYCLCSVYVCNAYTYVAYKHQYRKTKH